MKLCSLKSNFTENLHVSLIIDTLRKEPFLIFHAFLLQRRWRPTMIANSSRLLDLTIDDSLAYPDLTALPVGVFMRMCVWLPSSSAPMTPIFSERR